MAPQRLEKIESAPGNGMARKPRTYDIWYTAARLAKSSRKTILDLGKLQKKAPNTFKSLGRTEIGARVPPTERCGECRDQWMEEGNFPGRKASRNHERGN